MEPSAWVADAPRPGGTSNADRVVAQLCCCSPSSCSCSSHCSPPALAPQVKGAPGCLCLEQAPVPGLPRTFPQPRELLPGHSPVRWTLPSSQPPTALGMQTDQPTAPFVQWLSGSESLTCTPSAWAMVALELCDHSPFSLSRIPFPWHIWWVRTLHCPWQCQAGDGLNGPGSPTWHGCPAPISVCCSASAHLLHSLLLEDQTCLVPGDVPLLLAEAALAPGILQICMGQGCMGPGHDPCLSHELLSALPGSVSR